MLKVEGGGGVRLTLPPPSRLRVTIQFSSRLLGLIRISTGVVSFSASARFSLRSRGEKFCSLVVEQPFPRTGHQPLVQDHSVQGRKLQSFPAPICVVGHQDLSQAQHLLSADSPSERTTSVWSQSAASTPASIDATYDE